MAWSKAVVTNAGLELLAGLLNGKEIEYTRVLGGSSTVPEAIIMQQAAVTAPQKELEYTGINQTDSGAKIGVRIDNVGLAEGYTLKMVGLYAKKPEDSSDVLFAVMQDENGEYIPSTAETAEYILNFAFNLVVSNADNISVQVDSEWYVSRGDLSLYDNHLIARTVDVWSGMSSPYTCEIPFVGVAAESVIDVIFDNTVTVEQIDAWVDAEIKRAVTSTNKVTLYAYGKKPAIEIPVVLVKRGGINAG